MIRGLIGRVRRLAPRRIILVKADVYRAAFGPMRASGRAVVDEQIPFAGSRQQIQFRDAFSRALRKSRRLVAARRSPARRDQFLEAGAPYWLDRFIDDHADEVLAELGGSEEAIPACLPAVIAWSKRFERAGIAVVHQGRQFDNRAWTERGGFLVTGEPVPRDHHYLAVGPRLTLFDPTWRQFAAYGRPRLGSYATSQGLAFPAWRRAHLRFGKREPD